MPLLRLRLPRLPVQRVYRAFRELDGYSDEQCRRFVHAARGSARRRLFGLAFIVLVTLIGTGVGIVGFSYIQSTFLDPHRTLNISHPFVAWYGWLLNISLAITGFGAGPILGYLTRDFFLIRRVRHILRTRGVCISCRYTLVGLFVAPDLSVTCPECGGITTVDPALGELVTDEAGRARFKPDESRHRAHTFWTRARLRLLRRGAILLATTLLLVAASYEIFLRWQAGVAKRERPTAEALMNIALKHQPSDSRPSDPNAYDLFATLSEIRNAVDDAVWRGNPATPYAYPDFQMVYAPDRLGDLSRWPENRQQEILNSRQLALELLDKYRAAGLFDELDQMAHRRRCIPDFQVSPSEPLTFMPLPYFNETRKIGETSWARMAIALQAGDLSEYTRAAEGVLALARASRHEPILISHLVGSYCEAQTLGLFRQAVLQRPQSQWLDAIEGVIQRQCEAISHELWLQGEEVAGTNMIGWFFEEAARARFGRWSPAVRRMQTSMWPNPNSTRLGTYAGNMRTHDRYMSTLRAALQTPLRDLRTISPVTTTYIPMSMHSDTSIIDVSDAFNSLHAERDGLRIMIALERYRLSRGEYPATLSSLVPDFLIEIPIDPWSGEPLAYTRIDPITDKHRRSYLLYSIGSDKVDNGGLPPPERSELNAPLRLKSQSASSGYDWIVNDPDRGN
ncbi:MAG: hypothetical protein KIT19_13475 [Phycisphaeraceae bacterium]|nr:hypothetical protein [Phycisphaeraceae bacterium]